jgi:hypothetical protein
MLYTNVEHLTIYAHTTKTVTDDRHEYAKRNAELLRISRVIGVGGGERA